MTRTISFILMLCMLLPLISCPELSSNTSDPDNSSIANTDSAKASSDFTSFDSETSAITHNPPHIILFNSIEEIAYLNSLIQENDDAIIQNYLDEKNTV